MARTNKQQIADILLSMTHTEFMQFVEELTVMQDTALADFGKEWEPKELHGEYGLAAMLHSWAEGCD